MECQAYRCTNRMGEDQNNLGLTFHRFPKNHALRRCWEQAIGGENWTSPQGSVVCSDHFRGEDFHISQKIIMLNKGAKPSVFAHRDRDEHVEKLAANMSKVDIAGNSQSKFSDNPGPSVRGMMSIDCSEDSFSEKDEPRKKRGPRRRKNQLENISTKGEKFMEDFDPEKSNREMRKLSWKFGAVGLLKSNAGGKKQAPLYDARGYHIASGRDICDCMDGKCPGCHFPCPQCRSSKCGHECRVNRRHSYDCIEVEGTDIVLYPDF